MVIDNTPLNKGESHTGSEPVQRSEPSGPSSSDHPPAYEADGSFAPASTSLPSEVEPASSAAAPTPSAIVGAPHVSHVIFLSDNNSIKKEINIDLRAPVPQPVLNKQPTTDELEIGPTGEKVNIYMNSKNGSVKGTFAVWGYEPEEQKDTKANRIRAVLKSTNGSVSCIYRSRQPKTVRISTHASSDNGSVTLYLPTDYCGSVISLTKNGSLKLSARAKAVYTPMGYYQTESGSSRRQWELGFIGDRTGWDGELEGDISSANEENAKEPSKWDESWAYSQNGSIYIKLEEELSDVSEPSLGSKLFGSMSKAIWGV